MQASATLGGYVKKGISNTVVYSIASLIPRILNFILLPYMLSKLTLAEYGTWEFYQVIFSQGILLLCSCVDRAIIRYFIQYKNDQNLQESAIGNMCALAFLGSLISIIIAVISFSINPHFDNYFAITLLNIGLFAPFSCVISIIRVHEWFTYYISCFCGQAILSTLFTLIAITKGYSVAALFYANTASLLLFYPIFLYMAFSYKSYNVNLMQEQLAYGVPLLGWGFLFNLFFTIDKYFINYFHGAELLGAYAILWRFGSIFQFFAIALADALPLVLFNADQEENATENIRRILNYFCATLSFAALSIMLCSYYAVNNFLPLKYHYLVQYLPPLFLSLFMVEIGRVMMQPSLLAKKTIYNPLIVSCSLVIQIFFLFVCSSFGLYGVLLSNIIAFSCFSIFNYYFSRYLYSSQLLDAVTIGTIVFSIIFCLFLAQFLIIL